MPRHVHTYQVINGNYNGEIGVCSETTVGVQEADGWYYLDGPQAVNGTGPYPTEDAARKAADACPVTVNKLFQLLATGRFQALKLDDPFYDGIEHEGYAHYPDDDAELVVLLDLTPGGPHFQVVRTDDNGDQDIWQYRPSINAEHLVKTS